MMSRQQRQPTPPTRRQMPGQQVVVPPTVPPSDTGIVTGVQTPPMMQLMGGAQPMGHVQPYHLGGASDRNYTPPYLRYPQQYMTPPMLYPAHMPMMFGMGPSLAQSSVNMEQYWPPSMPRPILDMSQRMPGNTQILPPALSLITPTDLGTNHAPIPHLTSSQPHPFTTGNDTRSDTESDTGNDDTGSDNGSDTGSDASSIDTISLSDSEAMATLSPYEECREAFDFKNRDHTRALELLQTHIEVPDVHVPCLVELAIDNDWIDIVKLLITQYGYDPQQCDIGGSTTALHIAAACGHLHIVQYLHKECNCNVYTTDRCGNTPLHYAALGGHLDVVQYLHIKCNCNINTINNLDGATPLHRAADGGHLNVVQYLLGCGADAIATDNDGATPLQYACQNNHRNRNVPVIKYLLSIPAVVNYYIKESSCSSPLSGDVKNDVAGVYERVQVPHHMGSFVNVFLLGDSGVGKTTLCQAIEDRSYINMEIDGAYMYVQEVKLRTAGIVPNKLQYDESLGNVIIHDFAGQKEYYSSHAAVLENLLLNSGAVFVVVINLTQELSQQVRFWSSVFINEFQRNLSSECHLIVIGSHADKVREGLDRKVHQLKGHISKELADVKCSIYSLDCRLRSEDNLQPFTESLSHYCALIRNKQQVVSLYCIFLYYVLERQISKGKKVCCTLEELMSLCNQSRQKGVPLPDDIVPLLKTLHSRSGASIIYLENEKELPKSWIVFSKEILLTEVNGILFAPSDFQKHTKDIASNTGIITSSALKQLFSQYPVDMLIGFLKSMKLCIEQDSATLKISDPCSDQLLFFPALITNEKLKDIGGKFKIGWCLKFTSEYRSLISFLHALQLDLAYDRHIVNEEDKPFIPHGVERNCTVWKTGIHWYHDADIQALVEVKGDKCVVLMSCHPQDKAEEMVKQHHKVVKKVMCLQEKRFPNLEYKKYLLAPFDFQHILDDQLSEVALYSMEQLTSRIRKKEDIIFAENKHGPPVKIAELLPVEPKKYLEIIDPTPYTPTNIGVRDVTHNSATVHWNVSPEAYCKTYTVKYGTTKDNMEDASCGPDSGQYHVKLQNLEQNQTYYYSVMVSNINGDIEFEFVKDFRTLDPTPTNVKVTSVTHNSATVHWRVPLEYSPDTFFVKYGEDDLCYESDPSSHSNLNRKVHQVQLSDLEPYTTYYYQVMVKADNTDNIRETRSTVEQFRTLDPKPQKPANVMISDVTHNLATVRWSVFPIEYPPETYTVKYGTDRSNLDMEKNGGSYREHKDDHQVQLSALQWNTTYYCSVMVCNGCGREVETDPVTFTTLGRKRSHTADAVTSPHKIPKITVSSMIEDYQLPAEQVNSKVTIPHLIARHVVSWTHLAPYLGLTEPEIAAISKDGHDELGKQNMMLNDWIRKCGRDATYWHLLEVCLEAEDRELADNICQELQRCYRQHQ